MSDSQQGPRISRGEEAMYGELAYVVRQVSTSFVALTEGRDAIVGRLHQYYEEMHLPAGVTDDFGSAAEGTTRREWEESFTLVAEAEAAVQKALFGVTKKALEMRIASREGIDSLPVFKGWNIARLESDYGYPTDIPQK